MALMTGNEYVESLRALNLLVTKILERLMDRHPRPTYLVILGFMLASIASVL